MIASAPAPTPRWSRSTWLALYAGLALATLLIHGFHPFSEDGGLYAAGVEYTLDPALFPHYTAFVTAPLRYSLFAPAVAALVRLTHLQLATTLLLLDLATAAFTFAAARAILRRCTPNPHAQFTGLALLAAGWTLPIAGTSLLLMDPYVTARSLSMPLSLAAIALALDSWRPLTATPSPPRHLSAARLAFHHPALRCAFCLFLAAAVHPLMAFYALLFVAAIRATAAMHPFRAWSAFAGTLLLACLLLRLLAQPDSPASTAAALSRYYWSLSQWHWYERLGLLGPFVVLAAILRFSPTRRNSSPAPDASAIQRLCVAGMLLGALAVLCALLFAPQTAANHAVARLQVLRIFLLLYALMLLLLGASLYTWSSRRAQTRTSPTAHRLLASTPTLFTLAMAAGLDTAARSTYPASPHIELPTRDHTQQQNPWVQAFLWARDHTPPDALFALDARYVNLPGEDAQTFRAISLRSALPDYSKDGGEASITPALAPAWLAAATAQASLSTLSQAERTRRLAPYPVTWLILQAGAPTTGSCPYQNAVVEVCPVSPP